MKLQDERTTMKLNKRQGLLKKRVKLWKEYFEKLLGQLAIYTTPSLPLDETHLDAVRGLI